MKCRKCGMELAETEKEYESGEGEESMESEYAGDESSVKDSVLSELIDAMQGSVGGKLKGLGKPDAMSIEIISKPKLKKV